MQPHDRRLVDVPEDNHEATIVLTGATNGIGRATALALAERAGHLTFHGLERQDDVEGLLGAVRTTMRRSVGGRAETTGRSRGNGCCTGA